MRTISFLVVACSLPSVAHPYLFAQVTGKSYYTYCEHIDGDYGVCIGYTTGVLDTYFAFRSEGKLKPTICEHSSVKTTEIIDVVLKYIHNHKEYESLPASIAILDSLKQHFPC